MDIIDFPRLRHFTMLSNSSEEVLHTVVGTEHFELKEFLGNRDTFLNVKRYFDGRHSIEEISRITNVDKGDIRAIVDQFSEIGILRKEPSNTSLVPKAEFLQKVKESCLMWQRQIGCHKLFNLLAVKALRKEVLIGLFLETYHYVKSAPEHTGNALAHCKNESWKKILVDYLVDEYDHSDYYIDCLVELGIPKERVIQAHPLIGTSSLLNMLTDIGKKSTLGYLACTSLFEANKHDFQNSTRVVENIFKLYEFPLSALSGPLEHLEQDVQMGHNDLLSEALEDVEFISAEDAHYAVNCVHDLKHSFDQFHDQIIQYYSDISNYIPRLQVDYYSL